MSSKGRLVRGMGDGTGEEGGLAFSPLHGFAPDFREEDGQEAVVFAVVSRGNGSSRGAGCGC